MSLTDEFEAVTTDNEAGDVLVAPRLPLSDGLPGAAAPAAHGAGRHSGPPHSQRTGGRSIPH